MFFLLLSMPALAAGAQPVTPRYEGNCQTPVWSPDGTRLSYEVNFHERKVVELYLYEPGREPLRVQPMAHGASGVTQGFQTGGESVVHELSWAPADVGAVVYSASGSDQDYDLYLGAPLANSVSGSAVNAGPGADGGATWSPDGRWIAFTSARTGQGDIYILDAHAPDQPARRLTTDADASELYVTWSHDSRSLAYVGHTETGDTIYVIDDLVQPRPRAVASLGNTQTRPSFSPDGSQLAFYSNHVDRDRFDLYVMPMSGQPRLVHQGVVLNNSGPAWTPSGSHVVYVADQDDAFDPIYAAPAAGGAPAQVPTNTVGNGDLDVTKGTDGRTYLAVAAQGRRDDDDRDFKRIYVLELSL